MTKTIQRGEEARGRSASRGSALDGELSRTSFFLSFCPPLRFCLLPHRASGQQKQKQKTNFFKDLL